MTNPASHAALARRLCSRELVEAKFGNPSDYFRQFGLDQAYKYFQTQHNLEKPLFQEYLTEMLLYEANDAAKLTRLRQFEERHHIPGHLRYESRRTCARPRTRRKIRAKALSCEHKGGTVRNGRCNIHS